MLLCVQPLLCRNRASLCVFNDLSNRKTGTTVTYHLRLFSRSPASEQYFLLCGCVQQFHRAVITSSRQCLAIRRKCHRPDPIPVPLESGKFLSCGHVP